MTEITDRAGAGDRILSDVLQILRNRVQSADADLTAAASDTTRIMTDLEFESIAVVEFCMAINKHYGRTFPFQELVFKDGRLQDFTVSDLVEFLARHLTG